MVQRLTRAHRSGAESCRGMSGAKCSWGLHEEVVRSVIGKITCSPVSHYYYWSAVIASFLAVTSGYYRTCRKQKKATGTTRPYLLSTGECKLAVIINTGI